MGKTLRPTLVPLILLALAAAAQAQAPTCSITSNTAGDCSATQWLSNLTACQHVIVQCPPTNDGVSFADIGLTFGYENPTGTANGTIVFFSEGGGKTTDDIVGTSKVYAADYLGAGYQVVQTAWDSDWEDTGTTTKNIAYAAGRPAAFLKWVNNNLYDPIQDVNSIAGMCVQGASAGGAAAIYSLAWYGTGSFIDKVELLSSPPLSDIKQGCEVNAGANPLPTAVTVCPTGQLGCNVHNSPASWTQEPVYSGSALTGVRTWSGLSSCQGGQVTDASDNAAWKAMSIVDGTVGTFSYPHTNITAWVCSSVAAGDGTMNNSSPEAQLFFQQFTSSTQYEGLLINGVQACTSSEMVGGGTPPSNYSGNGQAAIEYDMITDTTDGTTCVSHHN